MREAFLEANPAFNGVMVGEGEETFLELAGYYVDQTGKAGRDPGDRMLQKTQGICHNGWRAHSWICSKVPFSYRKICRILTIGSFIMRAAEAVPFPAATVCLLSIKQLRFRNLGSGKKRTAVFPGS